MFLVLKSVSKECMRDIAYPYAGLQLCPSYLHLHGEDSGTRCSLHTSLPRSRMWIIILRYLCFRQYYSSILQHVVTSLATDSRPIVLRGPWQSELSQLTAGPVSIFNKNHSDPEDNYDSLSLCARSRPDMSQFSLISKRVRKPAKG